MTDDHDRVLWERLRAAWRAAGVAVRPGASAGEIDAFEANHGVFLPADMRDYFLAVDGMEDEMDPWLYRFWPLTLVKPVSDVLAEGDPNRLLYPDCFVFLDHCISAFLWCVRVNGQQRSASAEVYLLERGTPPPVADSFEQFIQMYLDDPDSILFGK